MSSPVQYASGYRGPPGTVYKENGRTFMVVGNPSVTQVTGYPVYMGSTMVGTVPGIVYGSGIQHGGIVFGAMSPGRFR